MTDECLYRVVVRHNVVCAITRVEGAHGVHVPHTRLEVSTQLARNNQENGCVDGDYFFADANMAKSFAILSLDFTKRLIEKTIAQIEDRSFTGEFDWCNAHLRDK